MIDLGGGEILALPLSCALSNGVCTITQRRSLDNWSTVNTETATVSLPSAVAMSGDDCPAAPVPQFFIHHGIIRLNDGRLIATMFGNYASDNTPADGYPASCQFNKWGVIVVFSSDKGKTWVNPTTVAESSMVNLAREGFDESDIVRAPNGDLLVFMRTGGYVGECAANPAFCFQLTPLYMSRSSNEGQSWSAPVKVADWGTNPNAVTLGNGVIVLSYGGAKERGGWVQFSNDNGYTWKGAFQVTGSDDYTDVIALSTNRFLLIYQGSGRVSTDFTVVNGSGGGTPVSLSTNPSSVSSGSKTTLSWTTTGMNNC